MSTTKTLAALSLLPLAIACGGSPKEAKSATGAAEVLDRSAWSYINQDGDTRVYVDAKELNNSAYFDAAIQAIPGLLKAHSGAKDDAFSPCIAEELKSAQQFALSVQHLDRTAPQSMIASVVTSSPQEHLNECLSEKGQDAFASDPARFNGHPFKEVNQLVVLRHGHALVIASSEAELDKALARPEAAPPKLPAGTYFRYEAKESPNPAFGLTDIQVDLSNAEENTLLAISAHTSSPGLARSMVRQASGLKRMATMQLESGKERYESQAALALGISVEEVKNKDFLGHLTRTIESFEVKAEENQLKAHMTTNTEFTAGYLSEVSELALGRYLGMQSAK